MNVKGKISQLTIGATLLATLAACGGSDTSRGSGAGEENVMIQKGTYVYNPNSRHAPVSLSRSDLQGIEIR